MYARYIPPPRRQTNKTAVATQAEEPPASSSSAPRIQHPTAYARYVPPPKPANQQPVHVPESIHIQFSRDEVDQGPPSKKAKLAHDDSHEKSKKKSKKSKKRKDEKSDTSGSSGTCQPDIIPSNQDVSAGDEGAKEIEAPNNPASTPPYEESLGGYEEPDELAETAPVKKTDKEKRKKKKKKHGEVTEAGEAQSETQQDSFARHRSVLEKKARSIRKPPESTTKNESTRVRDGDGDVLMQDSTHVDVDPPEAPGIHRQSEMDEIHGLEPLPQPKPIAPDTSAPTYETLPPWLAEPLRVSPRSSAPFTDLGRSPELGIAPESSEKLAARGYKEAFAIQTVVIPLLLPHLCKTMQGDVLVSAATGSGKTLAYTLPIVRDLSNGNRHLTRLRALVVLPTRELVRQVQQVCEQCAGVFTIDSNKRRPRVAIAMGSQSLESEQSVLIERIERYDPQAHAKRRARFAGSNTSNDDEEDGGYNTEDEERAAIRNHEDSIQTMADHVIDYKSKVDILICTPGRLVDHIKNTPGFNLDFVRWLVVDEADKLLGQNFQQWLEIVVPRLQSDILPGARNHKQSNMSGVRKIILSATMTRDLDQLEGLKLRRPKLVVLEGAERSSKDSLDAQVGQDAEHALPEHLEEAAIKVVDPNLKPLFLLGLLLSKEIWEGTTDVSERKRKHGNNEDDDETSSSGSDSGIAAGPHEHRSNYPGVLGVATKMPTILIFTKSNETALRLSRLLAILAPALSSTMGTLTSTTPYTTRSDTIHSFTAGKLRLLVASDLVARGIDLPFLDYVINYDMPASIASYVHRVGRTARAGKSGKAWTFFTNPEARWFWNEIAGSRVIRRGGDKKVERIRITEEKHDPGFTDKVGAYEAALQQLGQEATGGKERKRGREQYIATQQDMRT